MEHYPWWNEAQCKLADEAREAIDNVIMPMAAEYSRKKEYPWKVVDEMRRLGWFAPLIPERYGGRMEDWGVTGACILCEEISRCGALVNVLGPTLIGGVHQIIHFGTDEQKERWLPRLASGELLGAITLTEPYAGSDAAAIETTARFDGDVYIVNGKKRFITNAGAADIYMTYFKTSDTPEDRKRYGHLTGLVVEKGSPGFTVERVNELVGLDGIYNAYLDFRDARIPAANRLGEEGQGWKVMMSGLNVERTVVAAGSLGPMREALKYAVYHMERRIQFGQPTINLGNNQFRVADMIAKLQLARLATYYTAYLFDLGRDAPVESAMSKLFNTDAAMEFILDAIQCMGGDGCTQFYPLERLMRDAKISQVYAGTNEIQKMILFRHGLQALADDLKVPRRAVHPELKVPVPLGPDAPPLEGDGEEGVLEALAEHYRVHPGLHIKPDELAGMLRMEAAEIGAHLDALEGKGLAKLIKDRKGRIKLARATLEGLARAKRPEEYRYFPEWVREEDLF